MRHRYFKGIFRVCYIANLSGSLPDIIRFTGSLSEHRPHARQRVADLARKIRSIFLAAAGFGYSFSLFFV